jgi:hypothetical protein
MRNGGEMDDLINVREQRRPIEWLREVRMRDDFNACRKWRLWRSPHGGAQSVAVLRKSGDDSRADKTRRASYQQSWRSAHSSHLVSH